MVSEKTFVKTITVAQMTWLINASKVWFEESEDMFFNRRYCYRRIVPTECNPEGGWEVHS